VLCHLILKEIEKRLQKLDNQLFAKHVITKYMLLYAIREYFEGDANFSKFVKEAGTVMRNKNHRMEFSSCIGSFLNEMIVDLNMESKDFGDDFDYRDKLRDQKWVRTTVSNLVREYQKQKARGKSDTFEVRMAESKIR
jgi:hypothetical protein